MSIEYTDKEKYFSQEEINPVSNSTDKNYPNSDAPQTTSLDTFIVNTEAGTINMSQGSLQSPNFSTGNAGWKIDSEGSVEFGSGFFRGDITGATGSFSGSLTGGSLNVPDTTTTNSFHVDTAGNAWWGANVASGLANANASITSAGLATFKNALVGGTTTQYAISDNGIYTFGDGSDGNVTFDGSTTILGLVPSSSTYTMTRDIYVNNMTVNNGVTVKPNGYRIFGTGTLTNSGTIQRNGNAGGNGGVGGLSSPGTGGTAGAALADGYLKGSPAGGAGATSTQSGGSALAGAAGSPGTSVTNALGNNGGAGGNGGQFAGNGSGGAGGAAGTVTASNVKLQANWHLQTLLDISSSGSTVKFTSSASGGGGGSGGTRALAGANGCGGGGGGSPGAILAIYFRNISNSGTISANGGAGGAGGSGGLDSGGGGGSGGAGGEVILVYNTITNSGTISANGGAAGAAGTDNGGGTTATAGAAGAAGSVRQFKASL